MRRPTLLAEKIEVSFVVIVVKSFDKLDLMPMKKISFKFFNNLNKKNFGLSDAEVVAQNARYGSNEIVEATKNPLFDLVKDTLKDPMIWFLLGIGATFLFVGNMSEAIILFIAIIPLIFMDAFLLWRTQASTLGLRRQLSTQVKVLRNSRETIIDSSELVPGDVVIVSPGLFLPADGFFKDITDLQVDESVLTGESFPVHKKSLSTDPFELADVGETLIGLDVLGFAGTRILTGKGYFYVLLTGKKTVYGEIVQSVSAMPHERTPLQKSIAKLVWWLIFVSGAFCVLLACVRIYQGHGLLDAVLSAATLAIAAIPEEFPVVFTFFLGVGVYRLARKHALVRRSVSVENIGRVTYICTDKTGTITIGQLKLTHIDPCNGCSEKDVLVVSLAASDPLGSDPVDLAIQEVANKKNILPQTCLKKFPFTEDRRRETTIVLQDHMSHVAYLKGSPETVLLRSAMKDEDRTKWLNKTTSWARQGHKVLACARKNMSQTEVDQSIEPEMGFEFCGLIAFEDPPRPEVRAALEYCRKNGIHVLMITGDHPATATAIAKEVGLGGVSPIVGSAEEDIDKFQQISLNDNPDFLKRFDVIARCSPLQKLNIVNALKNQGELVAVTGDGVNDVPALKAADIGIAMGERGSRSAKEVSSIILSDDNFSTIVNAIMEGRQLFLNLKMSFEYLLLFHIPFVLTAAFIPLLGYPLLYLPIHVVWLELIIHPTALFAYQQTASRVDKSPQNQKTFFTGLEAIIISLIGIGLAMVIGYIFQSDFESIVNVDYARAKAMAILMFWSAGLVLYFTYLKTRASLFIFISTILSSIVLIESKFFSSFLHLKPLIFSDWLNVVGVAFGFYLLLMIKKNVLVALIKTNN